MNAEMNGRMSGKAINLGGRKGSAVGKLGKVDGKKSGMAARRVMLEWWAKGYVKAAVSASAVLNGYGALVESRAPGVWLYVGVTFSALVPGFVWLLYQGAAWAYRAAMKREAYAGMAVGTGLLVVSLCHCAHALALLLGLSDSLAWAMAIGIDCGLVWAEWTAIRCHQE